MKKSVVQLSEVTQFIRNGKSVRQTESSGGLPITRIETISDGEIIGDRVGYAGLSLEGARDWLLRAGDILFSHINSVKHLGKTALYQGCPHHLIHGMNLLCIRPDTSCTFPKYLHHCLRSSIFKRQLSQITNHSVNQSSIAVSRLKTVEIPLPPLHEQKRIAAILDKADAIRRKRRESIRLMEEFLRSAFLDMFGDPVTNPMGWPRKELVELGVITTGNTPSRAKPEYYGSDLEWIKSDNINTPRHYVTEAAERISAAGCEVARTVPMGSIVVTCIAGSKSCIGNVAMADREVAFNQQINAVTPLPNTVLFFLYVQLLLSKTLIQGASTQSMKGMVSKSAFSRIKMMVPPSTLQAEFGKQFEQVEKLSACSSVSEGLAELLFDSLVQRSFRGDL